MALAPRAKIGLLASLLAVALAALIWALRPQGPPVVLTGMRSNAGWTVIFHLREPATEIEYKRPTDADFVSTGQDRDDRDQDTNAPRARTFVTLDDLHGRVPFEVRYRGRWGLRRGPYPVVFDTDAESVASMKSILAMVPGWVSFRVSQERNLCYFTTLLSMKYALREIRYGVDSDAALRRVPFDPSDKPGIGSEDTIYVELPRGVSFVTVELTFLDGTRDKRRFPFHAE